MNTYQLNCDDVTTSILLADIKKRKEGIDAERRIDGFSNLIQKGAIFCLAGILPLAAVREYSTEAPLDRGTSTELIDRYATPLNGNSSVDMDLSTLQDLVSGVGVMLAAPSGTYLAMPKSEGNLSQGSGRGAKGQV